MVTRSKWAEEERENGITQGTLKRTKNSRMEFSVAQKQDQQNRQTIFTYSE